MINIGLMYVNKRMLKHLKRYLKNNTNVKWKDVYTVNMILDKNDSATRIIIGGSDSIQKLWEGKFEGVFYKDWEKGYSFGFLGGIWSIIF